ncbi:MAG: helix-turn-helix domain-containing protein [Desulfurococcales archaeon]|nr:helix-turn-helix domain-containing protein [Desulfurococcales archaeon]
MSKFLHHLSKDARRRIIEVLASGRSQRDLAEDLGVTPAAVNKYLSGTTHPSDRILLRALTIASRAEMEEISMIIAEDLISGLEDYIKWAMENKTLYYRSLDRIESLATKSRLFATRRAGISLH